jgi:predicted ATPase
MAIEVYSPLRETQYDSHTIRRPKEFGSLGRAAALKNKKINLSSLRLGEEKIVGRQTELKQIVEELDKIVQPPTEMASSGDSKQNDSKVIIIEGEAGIGKTRFVQEVYNMALRRKIKSLVGSTYSIEANTTYFAWKEIFAGIFDIDRSQDPGGSRGAPQDRTEKVLEKLTETAPEFIDLAPLLSAVLPIDLPDNDKTAQISGQLRAEKLQAILMKMILASDIRLIVLENAHWLDSASWQLAYAATQELKHVAIILAMRPDVKPMEFVKIQQLPGFLQIKLSGLHAEDVEELVKNRLEAHSVPKEVVQLVYEKGAGNPMLIGEFIDALKHSGRIDVTPTGECRVNRAMNKQLSTLGIPDTLRGLITGKVDRLSQSQQMILKVASVIGRVFEIDILQQILQSLSGTSLDPDTIMNDVILLEAADMIQLKTEEPLSYTFKQNMTQEVVYELMLHAQRRVLHEKVAEWYETHENDQGGEAFNLLAHHWKEAENVEKAMSYYSKSGERALANSANREAVTFFTEAIELQHKYVLFGYRVFGAVG